MRPVMEKMQLRLAMANDASGDDAAYGAVPLRVKKRDGRIVDFDDDAIARTVVAACASAGVDGAYPRMLALDIVADVKYGIAARHTNPVRVEDIDMLVKRSLVARNEREAAHAYTSFRLQREIEHRKAADVTEAVQRLVNRDDALVRENANKDSNIFSTQRDLLSGSISKATALNTLPKDIANAHLKGDIHFHDADYSPFTAMTNCCLADFGDMLARGFELGNAPMDSPKSIEVAATQITQIIKDIAGEQYGGQTVNRADEMLAPYAQLNYRKNLEMAHVMMPDDMPQERAQSIVEMFHVKQPQWLHLGDRPNIELDEPFDADAAGVEKWRQIYAKLMTRKNIYDAMQTMEYQINSNRSSNGQTPFVTVGFGLGASWFAREIQRAILLNRIRGLGKEHRTAIFPKLVFAVKKGLNLKPGDPNYDIKELAIECATKRMYPDALFYENIVAITGSFKFPMGCRSFLHAWKDPETGQDVEDGRMNLGVVSVNVPRVALESGGDVTKFWKLLNERCETAHRALQVRIRRVREAKPVNAPSLYMHGGFARLKADDDVTPLFANERASVSLGYIGLYEATSVFFGKNWMKNHSWDPKGKKFALSIARRVSELCKKWSKEEGYHYSLYSTPAESLTDRFNRLDRQKFGVVPGVTDHDFYTNSFHYPVWLSPTPAEKLQYEVDFPYIASGGFINYCEYPALQQNPKALEAVWDYADSIGIGYLGTNTPIDKCYVCGYEGDFEPTEDGFKCPECGNHDPAKCNVTKRTCGYLGNPVQRPMAHGRHEEIIHRAKHLQGQTGHVMLADGSARQWWNDEAIAQ